MLLNFLAQIDRKVRYVNSFEEATHEPRAVQEKLLLDIVRRNKDTRFGRMHHFSRIHGHEQYQRLVSLNRYEDLEPFIEEMKKGKNNVLTKDKVIMFGMTSGTTGRPKYCPVTETFAHDYRKNWEIWMYYASRQHPSMFDGKILSVISPECEGYTKGGISYGSISGMMAERQSAIIKSFYAIPHFVYSIRDYEARYYVLLRLAIEKNISWFITPNPTMILLLAKKAVEHREDIIRDIREGTLKRLNISEQERQSIQKLLRPNRKRAEQLSKIKEFYPCWYWPKLSLISCWTEGSLPIYLRQFSKYFAHVPVRDIGLISTEGRASIPITEERGRGVLALTSCFFEFMPIKNAKRALMCDEIEEGKEYYLLLTNPAGLYRYHTNDIVRVSGFYHKAPVIEFRHKGEHITSLAGEKLTEWQVVNAVRRASKEINMPVDSFTAVAKPGNVPHYDLLVELHDEYDSKLEREFLHRTDVHLKEFNIEYRNKRESGRLGDPKLKIVRQGSYAELHKSKSIQGAHDAQVKIACLTEDSEFDKFFQTVKHIQ